MCKLPGNVIDVSLSLSLSPSRSAPCCCSFCARQHHYHCDYHQHLLQSHSVKVNALFYASSLITATACLSQSPPLFVPFSLASLHSQSVPRAKRFSFVWKLFSTFCAYKFSYCLHSFCEKVSAAWQLIAASWQDKPINIMIYIYHKICWRVGVGLIN